MIIDTFSRNIIFVFLGTSAVNFLNLLYQLLIAHTFNPGDFAGFNTILSILVLVSSPLIPLQTAVVRYSAEFNARGEREKIKVLLSLLLRKTFLLAILTFIVFCIGSFYMMEKLKIASVASGYILSILLGLSWVTAVLSGGVQGLELFHWLVWVSLISGALKIILAYLFIQWGLAIAGALGAFLVSSIVGMLIYYLPLKDFLSLKPAGDNIDLKEIFLYLFPVGISYFCFMLLVNMDMVLVKYFFDPEKSGLYSLAQMVGKIFLFLPSAISLVMFPKIAGLNARNMETAYTLRRSLWYGSILCIITALGYNLFPSLALKVLTGKVYFESIFLGRLFSVSMSFFALIFILINYFLSKRDLRFIKYLVLFSVLQVLAIFLLHKSIFQVQLILCINAILIFLLHLFLAYRNKFKS
ncbi:MAG: oligosaccharide flippase family protein [Candidatus Omnitrophica bacterium]|nr:oligosaccharide flippase family protein [Candidatus Omnitrophota bacterium]